MKQKCLVLGVNGQDGSFLAEHLIAQGHQVFGIGRQAEPKWLATSLQFEYISLDLANTTDYEQYLRVLRPEKIFSCAAVHGPSGFDYHNKWRESLEINCITTQASLEYLRRSRNSGLYYLSSSKAFATDIIGPITEQSPRATNCLYSLAKNTSTELISYYRRELGVSAAVIWTFNHESIRRSREYFIPKLMRALYQSINGYEPTEAFDTLDFWCDWGCAKEYMKHVQLVSEKGIYENIIVATGNPVWARSLAEKLFARFGLTIKQHIKESPPETFSVDKRNWASTSKLEHLVGSKPRRPIDSVCIEILETLMKSNRSAVDKNFTLPK